MTRSFSHLVRVCGLLAFCALTAVVRAQTPALTAERPTYNPAGGYMTLTSSLAYPGRTPSVYAFGVQLPPGWTFVSQSLGWGLTASVSPTTGDTLLEWAFSGFPADQLSWTFTVAYPPGLTGDQTITVTAAQYRSPTADLSVPAVTLKEVLSTRGSGR